MEYRIGHKPKLKVTANHLSSLPKLTIQIHNNTFLVLSEQSNKLNSTAFPPIYSFWACQANLNIQQRNYIYLSGRGLNKMQPNIHIQNCKFGTILKFWSSSSRSSRCNKCGVRLLWWSPGRLVAGGARSRWCSRELGSPSWRRSRVPASPPHPPLFLLLPPPSSSPLAVLGAVPLEDEQLHWLDGSRAKRGFDERNWN